jgi:hypothetical protein
MADRRISHALSSESPDDSLPAARHERRDVSRRFVWGAPAFLLGSLIAIAALVYWLFPGATIDRMISGPLPQYPSPRLQSSPRDDMAIFRQQQLTALNGTGWADREHGTVHIPIDDAMRQLARDGIPGWPASAARP